MSERQNCATNLIVPSNAGVKILIGRQELLVKTRGVPVSWAQGWIGFMQ
jgi:hypothetical protein